MKYFPAFLIFLVMFSSCSKRLAPSCIREKISEIRSQPKWNPPAQIDEYEYNGEKVYLITADCCDQYIVVVNGKCSYICAPSGGIRGTGDGKCTDFYEKAKHIRLVWKDER